MKTRAEINRDYDRASRDPEAADFYRSAAWRKVREIKLARNPFCERCEKTVFPDTGLSLPGRLVPATTVHHKIERAEKPALALDLDNLESLCAACHNRHHKSSGGGKR